MTTSRQWIKYRRARLLAYTLALLVFVLLQGNANASSSVSGQNKNSYLKDKSKLDLLQTYATAKHANETEIEPDAQGKCGIGVAWRNEVGEIVGCKVHPLVTTWLSEEDTQFTQRPRDVYAGVSLDGGGTWKRVNLSRSANKVTKGRQEGLNYPGNTIKPMLKVKGNKILVAWTGKLCSGSGLLLPDGEEDMFQIKGSQRSVTYKDYPEKGEVPFSCVWTARGTVNGNGEITWFMPQQLTSGRRDANQIFAYALGNVGFGLVWQEDPIGLRAGEAAGPGEGWSGATVNHKTDIWFSFLDWKYFDAIDEPPDGQISAQGEPSPEGNGTNNGGEANRPFAKYPFSSPIRVSSNAPCRWVNSYEEWANNRDEGDEEEFFLNDHEEEPGDDNATDANATDGNHNGGPNITGPMFLGSPYCNVICDSARLSEPNWKNRTFCVTEDGTVLDGSRGASRATLAIQKDGEGNPIAMVAWEETKGNSGRDKGGDESGHDRVLSAVSEDAEDVGKNVKFVSFNTNAPQPVQVGAILNLPELDDDTKQPLLTADGNTFQTDNARRIRFLSQPLANMGPQGNVAVVALWRQGRHGHGKPADIMMRIARGGYGSSDFDCDTDVLVPSAGPKAMLNGEGKVCTKGVINLSSPRVVNTTDFVSSGTVTKIVTEWSWRGPGNRYDPPHTNPYDDARAHRGTLQGDKAFIAFTWTPNWGRGISGYQAYIVRSFTGFSKKEAEKDKDSSSTVAFMDRSGKQEDPKCFSCRMQGGRGHGDGKGVMEPRLVKAPGTIKVAQPDGTKKVVSPDDVHNDMVYFAAFGTVANPNGGGGTGRRHLQGDDNDSGFDAGQKAVSEGLYIMWTDNDFETIQPLNSLTGVGAGPNAGNSDETSTMDGETGDGGDNAAGNWNTTGNSTLSQYKLADSQFVLEAQAQLRVSPSGSKVWASYIGNTKDDTALADAGGAGGGPFSPCGSGTSRGSAVCMGLFVADPFKRYKESQVIVDAAPIDCKKDLEQDLNGDEKVNKGDLEICLDVIDEYTEQQEAVAWMGTGGTRTLRASLRGGGVVNHK